MNILKHVPLGEGIIAVVEVVDHTQSPDPVNESFSTWFAADRDWNATPTRVADDTNRFNQSGVLHSPSLTVDRVQALLNEVPMDTPAGRAWHAQISQNVALTLADTARSYDEVILDTTDEIEAAEALSAFAETLAGISPMLIPVADEITHFAPVRGWLDDQYRFDLGDMLDLWARITDDGIVIGNDGHCDKHEETCYGDDRQVARWAHIDAIAPGTETMIRTLVDRMRINLPTLGTPDETGTTRRTGLTREQAALTAQS